MSVFDSWNKNVNSGLIEEVNAYDRGEGGSFEKVPYGHYEVKVESIELGLSKTKKEPQMCIVWKIIKGENKGKKIWQFQNMAKPFGIHLAKDLLKKLDSGWQIDFKDYDQFSNLCMDVAEKVNTYHLEYGLKFSANEDGYDQFDVTDVFETE